MGGLRISPDLALDELRPADSAMLILPGADTWLTGGNRPFAAKARDFLDAGVPVAAICGATAGLAAEGLLDDRRHTSNAAEFLAGTGYGGAAPLLRRAGGHRRRPHHRQRHGAGRVRPGGAGPARPLRAGRCSPPGTSSSASSDPAGYEELMAATAS